jgi:3-deoxy-D-manno-octulosonic-acid transferase
MQIFMCAYTVFWALSLPFAVAYLFWRSRTDISYRKNILERFGIYKSSSKDSVWIHAVSMGEMRSAGPLVHALLDQGEMVMLTHFTPAGRKEAQKLFANEIANGRVISIYVPIEFNWAFRSFFNTYNPKYGLVMEIEWWPRMISASRRYNVPLFACNAQYPSKSFERDLSKNSIRSELPSGFAGILSKSKTQSQKFRQLGVTNIAATGELRFDQFISPKFIDASKNFNGFNGRPVITVSSVVEGEDAIYISAIKSVLATTKSKPVFIYVTRAPERFDESYRLLQNAGLSVARRSISFDAALSDTHQTNWSEIDVLLGDSMGEMYFFLALCDVAITGGGFAGKGAHNVIEPLALKKPVIVGPEIQTIEYPAFEAIKAGVLTHVTDAQSLVDAISKHINSFETHHDITEKIEAFYAEHAGACAKTIKAIPQLIANIKDSQ